MRRGERAARVVCLMLTAMRGSGRTVLYPYKKSSNLVRSQHQLLVSGCISGSEDAYPQPRPPGKVVSAESLNTICIS